MNSVTCTVAPITLTSPTCTHSQAASSSVQGSNQQQHSNRGAFKSSNKRRNHVAFRAKEQQNEEKLHEGDPTAGPTPTIDVSNVGNVQNSETGKEQASMYKGPSTNERKEKRKQNNKHHMPPTNTNKQQKNEPKKVK